MRHCSPTSAHLVTLLGSDPYLQGEIAFHTIKGIQSKGVQATAKHYILNEQEHYRQSSSSNIDDATLHEIYLHPFLRSVQADVAVRLVLSMPTKPG